MVGKRGWIRVVEAFVAVLLITGVVLVMINQGYIGKSDISQKVYQAQLAVLREIELDNELRDNILVVGLDNENEVKWDEFKENLEKIWEKIDGQEGDKKIPDYLECEAKICLLNAICEQEEILADEVYAQAVAIAATQTIYSPRQLKLFCWTV